MKVINITQPKNPIDMIMEEVFAAPLESVLVVHVPHRYPQTEAIVKTGTNGWLSANRTGKYNESGRYLTALDMRHVVESLYSDGVTFTIVDPRGVE